MVLEPYSLNKDQHYLNMNGLRLIENNRIQIFGKQFCKLCVNYNISKCHMINLFGVLNYI